MKRRDFVRAAAAASLGTMVGAAAFAQGEWPDRPVKLILSQPAGSGPDILARYPAVVGGAILVRDVTNGPTPVSLLTAYQAEQQVTLQRIGNTPLSQIASLAAWRTALRGFGVEPTQYRSAAEALLRRLTKKGDIPSINLLVDLGYVLLDRRVKYE